MSGTHSLITCPSTCTQARPHTHPCMHRHTHTHTHKAQPSLTNKRLDLLPLEVSLSLRLETGNEVLEPELSGRHYSLVSKPEPSGALDR